MQYKLTLGQINQIQDGLNFLSRLSGDKKNPIPFSFRWNISQWLIETESLYKRHNDAKSELMKRHGEEIYAKESVLNAYTGAKVTNYDEDGTEKLIWWRTIVQPEHQREYDKELTELEAEEIEIGKVKLIKQSELSKMEKDKIIEPLSPDIIRSLEPIIEKDEEQDQGE